MDQDQILQQFCSITGANPQDGRFFLDASNWDLEAATSSFFDRDQGGQQAQPQQQVTAPKPTTAAPTASKPKQTASSSSGRIKGFSDYGREEESDEDEDSNYYAGGEKSGLQIQDPNKKKKTGNAADIVQDVFENAKKHGAKPREDMPPEEKEKFTGSGYKLGNTVEPSRIETAAPKPVKKGPVNKKISFYKNGFTIDDGPLRNYNDPQNASFLSDINKGIIPRELEHEAQNGDMQISLEDKKHEDWKEPPKPKVVPFSGHGNTLSSTSTSTYAAPEVSSSPVKPVQFSVDESQPITTLQIRLHDGTRMVAKFNQTHTVADVRRFVEMAKKTPPFDLMTSFPTKVLADSNQSLKDAGLINATVVQKLK